MLSIYQVVISEQTTSLTLDALLVKVETFEVFPDPCCPEKPDPQPYKLLLLSIYQVVYAEQTTSLTLDALLVKVETFSLSPDPCCPA